MNNVNILGIDIAKQKFDVALMVNDKIKHKVFRNNAHGFSNLLSWLAAKNITKVHACLEATGIYGDKLASFLYDQSHIVSVVNPLKIKSFAQSSLCRNKTDKADAKIIAQFCKAIKPEAWQPLPAETKLLRLWIRRLDGLSAMQQQEKNHLSSFPKTLTYSIKKHISLLEKEIDKVKEHIQNIIDQSPVLQKKRDLLNSIPGVGPTTINKILAFLANPERFKKSKQVAAYVGLTPRHLQSGSSVHGATRISKIGDANLRQSLYFPAISAKNHNPIIMEFAARLAKAGKSPKAIVCACMRKLIHIIYGVLKSGKYFDPNYLTNSIKKSQVTV